MKITILEFNAFIIGYYKNPDREHLRFGQAFCNQFITHLGIPDPDLYYEPVQRKAEDMIRAKYIDYN